MRYFLTFLCCLAPLALADNVAVPNTLSNNTVADANAVQQNFQALVDESNENDQRLDDAEASIDTFESYFPADRTTTIDASGWYTIAYLPCANGQVQACVASLSQQKGSAYFMVRSDTGGKHQLLILFASSLYGQSDLKVLQSKTYAQQPLTDARVKKGGTYDGGLLQVYVDPNGGSVNVTARLTGREHEGNDNGWNLVDWVADGDAIDSVDYGLLTSEVLKPIPTQVQYLADFSCTAGQVIEWNNTRSQWECADLPTSPTTMAWVDADGNEFINGGHSRDQSGLDDYAVGLYKFPESNYAFKVLELRRTSYNSSLVSLTLYYESNDCSGQAYLLPFEDSMYPRAGRNASNWIVPDLEASPVNIVYNSLESISSACSPAFSPNINNVYPGNVSSAPLSVSERPPYSLQWR